MAGKAIIGEKIGMTQIFDADHRAIPVTVLKVAPVRVVQVKSNERDGYSALQVTYGMKRASALTKPEAGHFQKASVEPGRRLVELRLDDTSGYEIGQEIDASLLEAGEKVDVTAISKGKGFAGGMKRHNFKGQGASHGNHKHHRAPGSIGACATPGRVFKGTRMAGHMGAEKVTTLNLVVVEADAEKEIILVKGAVPGPRGGLVVIRKRGEGCEQVSPVFSGQRQLDDPVELDRLSVAGKAIGRVVLDPTYFSVPANVPLMHQVVTAQLAGRRGGTQSTKTRSEVSGGGAKPYRQKGTGNARQGTTSAPHYKGGGIALGPKPRKYAQATPKKMIQQALRCALSDRARTGGLRLIGSWEFSAPKTKDALAVLDAVSAEGRVLVVNTRTDEFVDRSFANLPHVVVLPVDQLTAYDVLGADVVIFSDDTLPGESTEVEVTAKPKAKAPTKPTAKANAAVVTDEQVPDAEVTDAVATEESGEDTK